jgi:hypothetical protein
MLLLTRVSIAGKHKRESTPILLETTARGRALYEYDQASWHATDTVQAMNPPRESLGRYIARKIDSRWTVSFGHLNESRDKFLIYYEADQGPTAQDFAAKKLEPPQEDTTFYLSAAKAIDLALHDFRAEKRPYNVAVIPAPSDQLYIYVMPAQTKTGIYPLGGDARYLITADGTTILEKRQLHKTILENSTASLPKDTKTAAGFHTHVLSDVPEDTDVFYVLTREPRVPEYVGTLSKKIFIITTDGTILDGGKL